MMLNFADNSSLLAHIARTTPPHLILSSMEKFDIDVHRSFAECTGCDVPDSAWKQAQLSLRRGGFGLRSLALHSPAAYIASLCGSGSVIPTPHLENAITHYNTCVPLSDSLSISGLVGHTPTQKKLSDAIEEMQFNSLLNSCSLADKARLLSVSSPHASAWISVVPSSSLGLHLDPNEFQTAVKWWLGVNPSFSSDGNPMVCPLCPNCALGCGWEKDNARTRPADILITNWDCGTSAAFDITVTSPLNSPNMLEAGMYQGVSAKSAEHRSTQKTILSVLSWAGDAYHWQLRAMEPGVQRCRRPSHRWLLV